MLCLHNNVVSPPTTPFLCFRVVIIFIIIKIFFYVCWYRSRQRQLAAYLSNHRNAQIVIVGGRAYLHQVCERPSVSVETLNWVYLADALVKSVLQTVTPKVQEPCEHVTNHKVSKTAAYS